MVCGITENGIGDFITFGMMDPIVVSPLVHLEFNGTMRAAKNVIQDGRINEQSEICHSKCNYDLRKDC